MIEVYLNVGSNLEKEKNIPEALQLLAIEFGQLTLSALYQSQAINGSGSIYFNMAVGFVTNLDVQELKSVLVDIENKLKRDRHNSDRVSIDIDLALYGNTIQQNSESQNSITLPHPDILEYVHALIPLAEIAGDYEHPQTNSTLNDLVAKFDKSSIQKVAVA